MTTGAATTAVIDIEGATEAGAGAEPRDRIESLGLEKLHFLYLARKKDLNPKQLRDCLAAQAKCLFVKDLEPGEPFAATASTFC